MTADDLFDLWRKIEFTEMKFLGRISNECDIIYDSAEEAVFELTQKKPGELCIVPKVPENPYSKGELKVIYDVPKGTFHVAIKSYMVKGKTVILCP